MTRCPVGHESLTDDYCSVCGARIEASAEVRPPSPAAGEAGPQAPGVAAAPRPATQTCPVCHTVAAADAFFCETCGYDFLTGALPRGLDRPSGQAAAEPADNTAVSPEPVGNKASAEPAGNTASAEPAGNTAASAESAGDTTSSAEPEEPPAPPVPGYFDLGDAPSHADLDNPLVVESAAPAAPVQQAPDPAIGEALDLGDPGADVPSPESLRPISVDPRPPQGTYQPAASPSPAPQPPASTQPAPPPAQPVAAPASSSVPPTQTGPARWVAEIWIDPEWYRLQQAPEQLPSPGQPIITGLRKPRMVIGRTSGKAHPDLDCLTDTGVSRQQAALTTDGIRWFVEDLGSSNGTYVGRVDQPLPIEPIARRTELGYHDRIYVGSWTRIVVRPALAQETEL